MERVVRAIGCFYLRNCEFSNFMTFFFASLGDICTPSLSERGCISLHLTQNKESRLANGRLLLAASTSVPTFSALIGVSLQDGHIG